MVSSRDMGRDPSSTKNIQTGSGAETVMKCELPAVMRAS